MKARRSFITTSCILLVLTIFLLACGNSNLTSTDNVSLKDTPADLVSLQDASADVQAIYKARCISCHGSDLSGRMGERTNLQNVSTQLSYDQIYEQITNGGDVMPGFKDKLTDTEIASLSEWLAKQ